MSKLQERLAAIAAGHEQEAQRLQAELDRLGPEYPSAGIVRYILRRRIAQEERRATWAKTAMERQEGDPLRIFIAKAGSHE